MYAACTATRIWKSPTAMRWAMASVQAGPYARRRPSSGTGALHDIAGSTYWCLGAFLPHYGAYAWHRIAVLMPCHLASSRVLYSTQGTPEGAHGGDGGGGRRADEAEQGLALREGGAQAATGGAAGVQSQAEGLGLDRNSRTQSCDNQSLALRFNRCKADTPPDSGPASKLEPHAHRSKHTRLRSVLRPCSDVLHSRPLTACVWYHNPASVSVDRHEPHTADQRCRTLQQVRVSGLEASLKAKEAEASALRSKLPAGDAMPGIVLVINGCADVAGQPRQAPALRSHKVTTACGALALSVKAGALHRRPPRPERACPGSSSN